MICKKFTLKKSNTDYTFTYSNEDVAPKVRPK